MKVAIRADASSRMGTGHVMRCLALAGALRERGAEVLFISRDHAGNLICEIEKAKLRVAVLPRPKGDGGTREDYAAWLGVPQSLDASETIEALGGERPDWLVVDHYSLGVEWERKLRPHAAKLMVIDDLANREHDCDLFLNQNVDRRPRVPAQSATLLGPRFALLRPEFAKARASLNRRTDHVESLLVFLGGADPEGVTLKVLGDLPPANLRVTVVVGAANPHREAIERLCRKRGYGAITTGDMAKLIAEADLAIGAGGSSTWERCCLGLPSIVIVIAENQRETAEAVAAAGACHLSSTADLSASLQKLLGNARLRAAMSQAGMRLVDGLGCGRVARAMLRRPVHVRPARADDGERVFPWRNAEETRRYFHDPRPLSLDRHLDWFRGCLADAARQLLIGEGEDGPVGVLRYDFTGDCATVSIYLDPALHGRGWGVSLLCAGEAWLRRAKPGVARIRAEVLDKNEASRAAFAEAGFEDRGALLEKKLAP